MRLNENDAGLVDAFLRYELFEIPEEILENIELGFFVAGPAVPLLVSGKFGAVLSGYLLYSFREHGDISDFAPGETDAGGALLLAFETEGVYFSRYPWLLLVRVNSWAVYVDCPDGRTLTGEAEEDMDDIRRVIEELRGQCASLQATTPSFMEV